MVKRRGDSVSVYLAGVRRLSKERGDRPQPVRTASHEQPRWCPTCGFPVVQRVGGIWCPVCQAWAVLTLSGDLRRWRTWRPLNL